MNRSVVYLSIGVLMELINIYSLLNVGFDTDKGTDFLIGEILFNVVLGAAGIIFIILGLRKVKR